MGVGDNIKRNIPTKLDFNYDIVGISCGSYHTVLNTTDGIYVCGKNEWGQLGLTESNNRNIPTKLNFEHDIVGICCGAEFTLINTIDGVFGCGFNRSGQLGLGESSNIIVRTLTKHDFNHEIISIHCGNAFTLLNTVDGIFVFGNNNSGELGLGDYLNRNYPTKLSFDHEIISIHTVGEIILYLIQLMVFMVVGN